MCLAGCSSNSGSSTATQGSGSGTSSGAGTTSGGASSTCRPFVIESETVATSPGARTRVRIGIGEEVNLTTNPVTSVTWTIESDDGHKGTLTRASGNSSQYKACDRSKTVTIKAQSACGRSDTHVFTVVQPSDGKFHTETDISAVTATHVKAGFTAAPTLLPADVSFYNCDFREGQGMSVSSGVLQETPEVNHADTGSWIPMTTTVGTNGTVMGGIDTVHTNQPISKFPTGGTTNGSFLWPIPWRSQVRGGGTNGEIVHATANHHETYTASSRVLKMEKVNRSKQRTVP